MRIAGKDLRAPWHFGSGPAVATLFARLFALVTLDAWVSLGSQVRVLIGRRGLLPVAEFMDAVRAAPGVSILDLPTLFWRFHSDAVLVGGTVVGAALAVAALAGLRPRICFALSTALYLSYATVGRDFLSFQWDNLLLECGLLASFLRTGNPERVPGPSRDDSAGHSPTPSTRMAPAPAVHFLFRLLLFKLYFESGLAKWQSPISDWQDGSAMTYYFETAPLPTWLAFYAHHLPAWWHHFESHATLVVELLFPFLIFGPRPARLLAAVTFSLFQIFNAATANYGFFCYLAAALHVFLLDDADVHRAATQLTRLGAAVRARWKRRTAVEQSTGATGTPVVGEAAPLGDDAPAPQRRRWLGWVGAGIFTAVSLAGGLSEFTAPGRLLNLVAPVVELNQRLRLINNYHLFASITRERIEPELQTRTSGTDDSPADAADLDAGWTPQYLWHKPGDPRRAPDFVAPHQPRVDFQLWFYGLSFQRREPSYVTALVARVCEDPAAVQPLFRAPLPPHPSAVRLVFWQYQFTSAAEKRATGAWWRRARLAMSRAIPCADGRP